jgi:hypothetical protein
MATHPVEPEPPEGEADPNEGEPNTSRLPVEPEFAPRWQPAEPEEPATHPHLP